MGHTERPRVTLTYAQSLDGSIAARPGEALSLSGTEALHYTHQLRAAHEAILVGIGTVLSDDPRLNVRLTGGPSPRPIILDSELRCPIAARCLEASRRPIIATTDRADVIRRRELEARGVTVLTVPTRHDNEAFLDLAALLKQLRTQAIQSIMIEGGAQVITSFLRARLVDRFVVTITPVLVGGVHGVVDLLAGEARDFPRLRFVNWRQLGNDWMVSGVPEWS
jgi:3,4-dihydroxy 2-butanone 4-phosphate synthase/GTP cyclohydrolase II